MRFLVFFLVVQMFSTGSPNLPRLRGFKRLGYSYGDREGDNADELDPNTDAIDEIKAQEALGRTSRNEDFGVSEDVRERGRRIQNFIRERIHQGYEGLGKGSFPKRTNKDGPDHKWHFANMAVWG